MQALVTYESMYGNTAKIAQAIAEGLRANGFEADVAPIDEVDADRVAVHDLLVVGGPTHIHGMSRSSTRAVAAKDTKNTFEHPTVAPGLRTWLGELPGGGGMAAAAFDTRMQGSKLVTGSAAKGIGRQLRSRGYRLVDGESFLVSKDNWLEPGEVHRATTWARQLAHELTVPV